MQNINGNMSILDWLIGINLEHSRMYVAEQEPRRIHRMLYRTKISVYKCGDGRCDFAGMTETPHGIIDPYRNIGGKFSLKWPLFQRVVHDSKEHADSKECHSLAIVTYHYSRGFPHLGCAGHNCDLQSARKCALDLKAEFDSVYGGPENQSATRLITIPIGMETDFQALILHGEDGQVRDLSEMTIFTKMEVEEFLADIYPKINDKAPNVICDLAPLVQGNIRHSRKVKELNLPVEDLGHKEFTIAYGRGFYSLPRNTAVIVGPWESGPDPIRTAATVVSRNLQKGIIETPVLLTSGIYRKSGEERSLAILKALGLKDVALDVIKCEFPDLFSKIKTLVTAVDLNTRKFDVIERSL